MAGWLRDEHGGKTRLEKDGATRPAVDGARALAVCDGALDRLTVEKANGAPPLTPPVGLAPDVRCGCARDAAEEFAVARKEKHEVRRTVWATSHPDVSPLTKEIA